MNKRDLQAKARESVNGSITCKIIPPNRSIEESGIDNPTFVCDDSRKPKISEESVEVVKECPQSLNDKT